MIELVEMQELLDEISKRMDKYEREIEGMKRLVDSEREKATRLERENSNWRMKYSGLEKKWRNLTKMIESVGDK